MQTASLKSLKWLATHKKNNKKRHIEKAMAYLSGFSSQLKQYFLVTGNYWAFTLTDGALRMLVVLYFHQLGYSPLEVAMLFLFYEAFGVITNLFGGWLGARLGLNVIMNVGLIIQIAALGMLLVPTELLTVVWVMAAQALSGIAKDLNKMSAKSVIKTLVPTTQDQRLFRWVALLTGSKNTLKGVGFFLGGMLLNTIGFHHAILSMMLGLTCVWIFSLLLLKPETKKTKNKPKFTDIFSKSAAVNTLSAARLFLFGARDVWFVVALPVYLSQVLGWAHSYIGAFFAMWIIAYGGVQAIAPMIVGADRRAATIRWGAILSLVTVLLSVSVSITTVMPYALILGLIGFGVVFAINSALHSYLIIDYAQSDNVSMDVGFYYMANASGRLLGTVLSGLFYQLYGLQACLIVAVIFLLITTLISIKLPHTTQI